MVSNELSVEELSAGQILSASSASFGTSGLRGRVEDLNDAVCAAATLGFLAHMKNRFAFDRVFIGCDLRPSSPRIAGAVAAAIRGAGFDPVDAGRIPTPALMLSAIAAGCPSIMVTGSHIPFDRNGLKFHSPLGEIGKADEGPILRSTEIVPKDLTIEPLPDEDPSARNFYLERYRTSFPGLLNGMRVGLWQHSAVGRDLIETLLADLGAEVVTLGRSDEFVAIDTEAVSDAHQRQAAAWVSEFALDALVSTDGDSDRPLLADETGRFFRGDVLGILASKAMGADAVAVPINANTALEKSGWFSQVSRTRIGSPYVLEALAGLAEEHSSVVGFEANGGLMAQTAVTAFDAPLSALPTRDAVLPVLATIKLARREGSKLSELGALLPSRVTRSDRLENRPTQESRALLETLEHDDGALRELLTGIGSVQATDTTDGLRITLDAGDIVHLRPSGNAPEFRIYVEAVDAPSADSLLDAMKSRLAQRLPTA